jgi:hypothetical protein
MIDRPVEPTADDIRTEPFGSVITQSLQVFREIADETARPDYQNPQCRSMQSRKSLHPTAQETRHSLATRRKTTTRNQYLNTIQVDRILTRPVKTQNTMTANTSST